jgi:ankyrin repeat protein
VNENHQTALLLAVDKKHLEIIKELLEHEANTNIQDDDGDTPLHTAVANYLPHSDVSHVTFTI